MFFRQLQDFAGVYGLPQAKPMEFVSKPSCFCFGIAVCELEMR
jgi:hypothetical protein